MCDACRVRGSARTTESPAHSGPQPGLALPADPALLGDRRLSDPQLRAVRSGLARQVQRGAGNRAMGRILARNGTETLPPIVAHKTGADVDKMLLDSAFFEPYIRPKYKKGIKAEGHVHDHDQAAWDVEIQKYLKGKQNPDTGNVFTDDEAIAFGKNVNAFRDGREIHANERRGEPATTVHESMHLFSADEWINELGFNGNEGATEYFTKKLCAANSITRGNFYPDQYKSVNKLCGVVGEKVLADAFFNGEIKAIKRKVDRTRGFFSKVGSWIGGIFGHKDTSPAERSGTWDSWVGFMKAAKYADADKLL
jgi:hypothetical protein